AKFSPFNLLYCVFPSPKTLAWVQLVKSLVAAAGAYLFFRSVLGVGFRAALFGAWCYPLTGFFTYWQGHPLTYVTAWLPWVLAAYLPAGSRVAQRQAGMEERKPGSLAALPAVALPEVYGSTRTGSYYLGPGNQPESSSSAYAGLLASLLAAPLAWTSPRHRS